jgi:gas vesicle protein GvpA/GvpJ/GvpM family
MNVTTTRPSSDVALIDLLDRVIGGGVVVSGDIVLGVADVDLVYLGIRLILAPAHEVEGTVNLTRGRTP